MKETMNPISAVVAAALGVLSAYMVQLFIPLIVLVIAMVVDYGTGMAKAWSAGELCSRTGIKGIIKKVGYLVIVLVAMGADYLLRYGMEQVGIHINVDFLIAAIVIAWLIINELISILENVAAIGAPAIGIDAAVVAGTLLLGVLLGRALKMDRDLALLTSTSSAIFPKNTLVTVFLTLFSAFTSLNVMYRSMNCCIVCASLTSLSGSQKLSIRSMTASSP